MHGRGKSAVLFQPGRCVLAYREEKFEVPMLLLEHVDGFEVAEEALVIPRIARVMDLFIGPFIGQEDFSGISPDVCEGVENVSDGLGQSLALQWGRMGRLASGLPLGSGKAGTCGHRYP